MTNTAESLAAEAKKLPPEGQVELVEALIASLSGSASDWGSAWSAEAARRWALVKTGETPSFPAETVLSDIAAHLEKQRRKQ